MNTTTKSKWFYIGSSEATEQLYRVYESVESVFQIVTKDRVVEMYNCFGPDLPTNSVLVTIIKRGSSASVLMYDMTFRQGWGA